MLLDDGTTIDANDLAVGESLLDDVHSLLVKVGLVVGGYEDGTIHD